MTETEKTAEEIKEGINLSYEKVIGDKLWPEEVKCHGRNLNLMQPLTSKPE